MKSNIYNQAKYYELAFSFVDAKKQVELFEKFIKKYSKIKVKRVLDLACGPSLQLREFARKNYNAVGLDANPHMLKYLKVKAKINNLKIETVLADINNFKLKKKIDLAFILMGSLIYTKNNQLFNSNLNSVAASLHKGGLYMLENLALNWSIPGFFTPHSWTMRDGKTKVRSTYKITSKNSLTQTITQMIKLEVDDNGRKFELIDIDDLKIILPEEFKLLVEKNGKFEFIGYFERYSTKLLKSGTSSNFAILRKK